MFTYKIEHDAKTRFDWPGSPADYVPQGLMAHFIENGLRMENYMGDEKPNCSLSYEDCAGNRQALAQFFLPDLATFEHVKVVATVLVRARGLCEADEVTLGLLSKRGQLITSHFCETAQGPKWCDQ